MGCPGSPPSIRQLFSSPSLLRAKSLAVSRLSAQAGAFHLPTLCLSGSTSAILVPCRHSLLRLARHQISGTLIRNKPHSELNAHLLRIGLWPPITSTFTQSIWRVPLT